MNRKIINTVVTALQILFVILSIVCAVIDKNSYLNQESYDSLFLNNIINIIIMMIYFIFKIRFKKSPLLDSIDQGMLLFIVYNCIPIFMLLNNRLVRITALIEIIILIYIFINRYIKFRNISDDLNLNKIKRIVFGAVLTFFSIIFMIRGIGNIYSYFAGDTAVTELSVSISDIVACIFWLSSGIELLLNTKYGKNIISIFFQSSLLFLTLILFLLINPVLTGGKINLIDVTVILVMGIFFFIPAVILLKDSKQC